MNCVLAFDPGPTRTAWGALSPLAHGTACTFVGGGVVPSTLEELGALCAQYRDAAVMAIEAVGLAHRVEARHALIQTAHVAGLLEGLIRAEFPRVVAVLLTAVQWRRALTGRGNANDASIKRVVCASVRGMPARTNCHVRDALGLAVVAAWNTRLRGGTEQRGTKSA